MIGDLQIKLITGLILGIAAALVIFFYPNQLFAVAVAAVGGFLVFTEVQRPLRQRDRQLMGFGLVIMLVSSLIFTGLVSPFSIVGGDTNIFDGGFQPSLNVYKESQFDASKNSIVIPGGEESLVSADPTNLLEGLDAGNSYKINWSGQGSVNSASGGSIRSDVMLFSGNTFSTKVFSTGDSSCAAQRFTNGVFSGCVGVKGFQCGLTQGESSYVCSGSFTDSGVVEVKADGVYVDGEKRAVLEKASILGEDRWFLDGRMIDVLYAGHYANASVSTAIDTFTRQSGSSSSSFSLSVVTSVPTTPPGSGGVVTPPVSGGDELDVSYSTEFVTNAVILIAVVLVGGLLVGIGFKKFVKKRR